MLKVLTCIYNILDNIKTFLSDLIKWTFNCLDILAIIFTYLSTLVLVIYLVKSCLGGSLLTPIACSISIFTLLQVNQRIRGGGK